MPEDTSRMGRAARLLPLPAARVLAELRLQHKDIGDRPHSARADAIVVSFPKSGRTWVRVLVSRLCQLAWDLPENQLIEFDNFHRLRPEAPRILFTHDFASMTRFRLLPERTSHYLRVPLAFLVRHPGDVVLSYQAHLRHRTRALYHQRLGWQPTETFIWDPFCGIPGIVRFLNRWAQACRGHPHLLLQRYEDFRASPAENLERLARHLRIPADTGAIADAVAFASLENMKKREAENSFANRRLGIRRPGQPDSRKVRSGRVGGWRAALPAEEAAQVETYVASNLDPLFGYEASCSG